MIRMLGWERVGTMVNISLEVDGQREDMARYYGLIDGHLESYMGVYGYPAGETLTYMIADYIDDSVEIPLMGDPEATSKIQDVLHRWEDQIEWWFDRDELLAEITLAEDTAEEVRSTWESIARQHEYEPPALSQSEARALLRGRSADIAAAHQRRQEELLAEEMISSQPGLNGVPRDTKVGQVGLTVKYV